MTNFPVAQPGQGEALPATTELKPFTQMIDVKLAQRNVRPSSIFLTQGSSDIVKNRQAMAGVLFTKNPEFRVLNDGSAPFYFIPVMMTLSVVTRLYPGNQLNAPDLGSRKPEKFLTSPLIGDPNSPGYNEHLIQQNNRKGYMDPQMAPNNPFRGYTYVHERKINFFVVPFVKNAQGQDVFEFPPFQWPLEKMGAVTLGENLMTMILSHAAQNPATNFPFDLIYSVNIEKKANKDNQTYFTYGNLQKVGVVKKQYPDIFPKLQEFYKTICDLISASQLTEDHAEEEVTEKAAPAPVPQAQQPMPQPQQQPQPQQFQAQQPMRGQAVQPQKFQQPPAQAVNQAPVPQAPVLQAPVPQAPVPSQPVQPAQPMQAAQPAQPAQPAHVQSFRGANPGQLTQKAAENFQKAPNNMEVSQTIDYSNQEIRQETPDELDAMIDKI